MGYALVTGANRGIGLELCKQLKARGSAVIAACRKASPALRESGVRFIDGLDVTSGEAVGALASELRAEEITLSLLINNAGILSRESREPLDADTIREQFEVNALGPLRVTFGLLSLLERGAKVGLITSRMGSITDNTSGGRYGYRMSKAALNMAGVSLAHDLRERKIAVAILHPGFVRTEMTHGQGFVDPPEAAKGLIERLDALTLEDSGSFWHANGERLPW